MVTCGYIFETPIGVERFCLKLFPQQTVLKKPLEVPSAFFLADTFKYLDAKHLKGKLLKPDKKLNEDKAMLAGREGLKAKRMIGALRYLWRSSPNACDWSVQDLKDLLQKSPERPQRVPPPENPVPRNFFSLMFWCFFLKKSQRHGKVSRGPAVITPTSS